MSATPSFTCITCSVVFNEPDIQRAHYKTDWHRYNLKRKVAELPPVTAENFNERVNAQQAQGIQQTNEVNYCTICTKKFSTKNQYENHLHSKKHKDHEAAQERKVQAEVARLVEKQKEKGLDIENDVIQCEKDLKNLALRNLQNRAVSSSASGEPSRQNTNPGKSRSEDVHQVDSGEDDHECEEVDDWEGEPLSPEQCLFCPNITDTFQDNVEHMTRAHSFYIPDLEFLIDVEGLIAHLGEKVGVGNMCLWCNHKGRLYLSIQACQRHMLDKGHCKVLFDGDAALEYADYYDYRTSYPDYEAGRQDGDEPEEHEVTSQLLDSDSFQLALPSGASIGHRSLMRYYKQNLPLVEKKKRSSNLTRIMAQYKALGWTGQTDAGSLKRAKDLGYLQRMKQRHNLRLGIKQNKFQPHLRPQVVF